MRAVDSTFALRTLIAALPEDRLGALLLELLLGQLQATTADPPADGYNHPRSPNVVRSTPGGAYHPAEP
jgi:hypothetical protein